MFSHSLSTPDVDVQYLIEEVHNNLILFHTPHGMAGD